MHREPGDRRLDVGHVDEEAVAADPPGVGLLAAALRVERRAVEHDLDGRPRTRRGHADAVDDEPDDPGLGDEVGVAQERGASGGVEHLAVGRAVGVPRLVRLGVGLGPVALLGHQRAEALLVDREPGLGRHLQRQVDREAVGVVQLERLLARELRTAALLRGGGGHVEDLRAGGEGLQEGVLLDGHHRGDPLELQRQLGVGRGHLVPHDLGEGGQHRLVDAQEPGRAHDPAQQAPQHVAAALVGRRHPVADDHHAGAGVVGDHPEPDVVAGVGAVAAAGELLGAGDHRPHEVGVVHAGHVLQQRRDALDAHAGVDVLLRQGADRREVVLRRPVTADVLHEDQVPDLQVAVLVGLRAAVAPVGGAAVEVDLRAGAAGTGHAHVPVVVLAAAALDAVLGQAGDLAPELERLVVVAVDGGPEPVGVDAVAARDQVPGVADRAFLEVVAEREVARPSGRTCCAGWSCRPLRCRRCARTSGSTWPAGRARARRRGSRA